MNSARFATFTYDIVDELNLGQVEKIASLELDFEPSNVRIPTASETQELSEDQVALRLYHPSLGFVNKYACYEAPLTQLNSQLLLDKVEILPDEIIKTAAFFLKRACLNQGLEVPEELSKLAPAKLTTNIVELTSINETEYAKKASACSCKKKACAFALPNKQKYPIDTAENIEKASSYFDKYASQMDPSDRLNFAINTCRAANEKGIKLAGLITKYGHLTTDEFNPKFASLVKMRKLYLNVDESGEVYDELLAKHASLGPLTSARALEAIDTHYSIDRLWGRQIADPIISTCKLVKEAEVEIDGHYVTQSDLRKILSKDTSAWIDESTKKELAGSDGLDVLSSLPQPTREGLLAEL